MAVCHGGGGVGEHGFLHGDGDEFLWAESGGDDGGLPWAGRRQVEDEPGGSRESAQLETPAR